MFLLNIISILLTLGTTPDCDGYGLCILEQQTEVNKENCLQAEISYTDSELSLVVAQKHMKDAVYIKQFTTEYFRIDKDISIPNDIADGIGLPQGRMIPPGKYPIYEEGGKVVVRIKM